MMILRHTAKQLMKRSRIRIRRERNITMDSSSTQFLTPRQGLQQNGTVAASFLPTGPGPSQAFAGTTGRFVPTGTHERRL